MERRPLTPSQCANSQSTKLQLREPRHHLRQPSGTIHIPALIDSDDRAFLRIRQLHEGLTGNEARAVDGAGGHKADALTVRIDHWVAVVRHACALFVEGEAHDHSLAFFLTRHEGIATDEPRLVGLHIRTKSTFGDAQVPS